jgi:hypothetical protein
MLEQKRRSKGADQLALFGPFGADFACHITTPLPPIFGQCGVSVDIAKFCISTSVPYVRNLGIELQFLCHLPN